MNSAKKIIDNFVEQLRLRLATNLKSVLLYGSLASTTSLLFILRLPRKPRKFQK